MYSPAVQEILTPERLPELGPGRPNEAAYPLLKALSMDRMFAPEPVRGRTFAEACLAGLWLYHDYLDESHRLSQEVATPDGSYWHAIMHRREPDAWNSKYWFRRIGTHPVVALLIAQAPALGYKYTTPEAFVDLCERVRGSSTSDEELARKVQKLEWDLLFEHCYRQAT